MFTSSVTSSRLFKSSLVFGLVVLLSAQPITVHADNTEDLLNIYGLTLGGPIREDIEKDIEDAESTLAEIQTSKELDERYNAQLTAYIKERENKIDSILNDISIYQTRNLNVKSNIENNVLTADISTLLKLDGEYKTNNKNINTLLENIDGYRINYSYRDIVYDTTDIEEQLAVSKQLYIESLDVFELGEVDNIKWVLDNERYITSKFGYRVDPLNSGVIRYHSGTDYRAPEGSELKALFNGEVISCGWSDTAGYYITIQSGENVKYFVCHLSEILVEKGDTVKQYDIIGLTGGTGSRSTGPHLHMALYLNGVTYSVDELYK